MSFQITSANIEPSPSRRDEWAVNIQGAADGLGAAATSIAYRDLRAGHPVEIVPVAELAALRSVVEALPRCHCGKVATWMTPAAPDLDGGRPDPDMPECDEHKAEPCFSGCCAPVEVPYAAALREVERSR